MDNKSMFVPSKLIHLVDENFNKLPNELMTFKL